MTEMVQSGNKDLNKLLHMSRYLKVNMNETYDIKMKEIYRLDNAEESSEIESLAIEPSQNEAQIEKSDEKQQKNNLSALCVI